ncbi:MAG: RsmB/NOP family class I SAM-dependent RNA methyltransferase [Planctomycetota bacterium]
MTKSNDKNHPDPAAAFARYRPLIDDWDAFLDAVQRPLPTCIWANQLRTNGPELKALLQQDGVDVEALSWKPDAFRVLNAKAGKQWPIIAGLYHIQEEVSMVPATLLDPQPGERVLDLCACPGGKTAQMAVAMENTGTIVANDLRVGRMRALRNTIERMGLFNVTTTHRDGTAYPTQSGRFDRILVDAPCSCEGTSRKNRGVTAELLDGGFRKNVPSQLSLLKRAVRLCKPGGRIVYSTCTYAPEENEAVVNAVLKEAGPEVIRLTPARVEGLECSPGITSWGDETFLRELENTMRVWPHQNDSGGFFVAVIEKLADEPRISDRRRPPEIPADEELPLDEDAERGVQYVHEWFGIPRDTMESKRVFCGRKGGYYFVSKEHRPPKIPAPDAIGLYAINTSLVFPKLSTGAALAVGHLASRNFVELDATQLIAYVERKKFPLSADATSSMRGRGYAVVRRRGKTIGLGFYRPNESGGGGELESYFPKGWGWGVVD